MLAVNNLPMYIIELLIAGGIAFVLCFFTWKEDKPEEKKEAPIVAPTTSVIRCAGGEVLQPVPGKVIAREEIPDETFATGILGDGVGIVPSDGVVVAPFDGVVTSIFDTKHAVTLEAGGMELLIHVGVNTVNMGGDGFKGFVEDGQEVKAGQKLIEFDSKKIKDAGYSDVVAVLLTNSDDLEGVECGAK